MTSIFPSIIPVVQETVGDTISTSGPTSIYTDPSNWKGAFSMDSATTSGSTLSNLGSTGSANDGTISGTTIVTGSYGEAFNFTGDPDQVTINDDWSFASDRDIWCAVLFRTSDTTKNKAMFGNRGQSFNFIGWDVDMLSSGVVRLILTNNNLESASVDSVSAYNDGSWHIAWFHWDNSDDLLSLYMDRSETAEATVSTSSFTNKNFVHSGGSAIGNKGPNASATTSLDWFIGDIDEVRIGDQIGMTFDDRIAICNQWNIT